MSQIINSDKKIKNLIKYIILGSIILGILFRILNLNYENLWHDEIFTFWITDPTITIKETYARVKSIESIPFMYYYLLKNLHSLFGYFPEVGRYFSVLFGILSIFSIGYLSKQISNNKSYLFVTFLISLNIFLISYSQEARVYIFSFFLVSIYLIFFLKVSNTKSKNVFNLNFLLFNFFQIISFLSFPFTIIIFISIFFFSIYERFFLKKKNFQLFFSLLISGIFLLIYMPYYIKSVSLSVNWLTQPELKFYSDFYFTKFFGSRIMGLLHLIVLLGLIIKFKKKIFIQNNYYFFLILTIFLFYLIPIIYGYLFQPAIHQRYIIFVLIPLIVIFSSLIFEIENTKLKLFFIIFFSLSTFLNHFTENTFKQFFKNDERYKPNFTNAFNFINNSEFNNIYFDLTNIKKENREIIFEPYENYSNYLFNRNELDINILNKFDNHRNLKGFWSICLFGKDWCNFEDSKFKITETKNFSKLTIKLYLRKFE